MISFLKSRWYWAKQKPFFWVNIPFFVFTVVVVFFWRAPMLESGPSDLRIRLWGTILQLLGAYIVWNDLTSTAEDFGKGNFVWATLVWLKEGFTGGPKNVIGSANISLNSSMSARAKMRRPINPALTNEERIANLERNVAYMDEDLDDAFKEIDRSDRELSSKINREAEKREASLTTIEHRLERAMTGNFSKMAFGAWWLFFGIILSSLSQELAKIAACQWRAVIHAL